ncbi:MAG: alpha-1,6-glucosidase [Burkholderiales bacterium PBB3]|nr:MAG: alpha-1,6-glucosidase [Burkholderiales bacterium PBB3]
MQRSAFTLIASLWATQCLAAGADPAALAACHGPAFQTVLQAAPQMPPVSTKTPQGVWLNRALLQWPEAAMAGKFKLYHSATGQLRLQVGQMPAGFDGMVALQPASGPIPAALATRFKYVKPGAVLQVPAADVPRMGALLQQQVLLVQEDANGVVTRVAPPQIAGALDDLYAPAANAPDLGATVAPKQTRFKLWAPTAQAVTLCHFPNATGSATAATALQRDASTGIWSGQAAQNLQGQYYSYLVDGVVPGVGLVRNRVTDPYSVSLNADSKRSYIADLNSPALKPAGWDRQSTPPPLKAPVDMTVYELHVRDFSLQDATVPAAHRGKYLAFTHAASNGMRHLKDLAQAGMTDVHLLPIFDLATVPEQGCVSPSIATPERGDSEAPQAATQAVAASDCFNWGYDPFHYSAPEGSYATDAQDGAKRVIELRQMVMALHKAGLRMGMDMVYNHTTVSGQVERSVLDRIVPGYYQRLDALGTVERSTCCDNTATENLMMGKLMLDSVALWTRQYRMDSFRFDLMAHQPRDAMLALQKRVNQAAGRHVNLIGEGWNFGEVANGARFVQASQLSLNGTGIGTFSDRGRDAVRGGSAGDNGTAQISNQGYINGMVYDRNALSGAIKEDLLRTADMVRVGLAGSVRNYEMQTYKGQVRKLSEIDYGGGQPAGYVSEPTEVVNYIENHDNQTLYDLNVFRLPPGTSMEDRVRVQMLGVAINAFSQGIAYFHAGTEVLRSKSMDRNSYDSGDWFNRLDWTYQTNYFGTGLPPKQDNGDSWALMAPLLADPANRPAPADIAMTRDMFNDLLKIRASTTLLRLRTAADIQSRLSFHNVGPGQNPVVQVAHIDGKGYPGANFKELLYFINVDKVAQTLTLPQEAGKAYRLHPVHTAQTAADKRPLSATLEAATGRFTLPARTALVYVIQ